MTCDKRTLQLPKNVVNNTNAENRLVNDAPFVSVSNLWIIFIQCIYFMTLKAKRKKILFQLFFLVN